MTISKKKQGKRTKRRPPLRSTGARDAVQFLDELIGEPLTLGNLLSSIRLGEGMTQAGFAAKLKISRSHVSDIENGRKVVSPARAAEFASILGYSQTQFVELALQSQVRDAGLNMKVEVQAVSAAA